MSVQVVGVVLHVVALVIMAVIFWGAFAEEKRSVADYHRVRDAKSPRAEASPTLGSQVGQKA